MKGYTAVLTLMSMILILGSCTEDSAQEKSTSATASGSLQEDSTLTVSEPTISYLDPVKKPEKSQIIEPAFPLEKLFHAWVNHVDDPHAAFDLTKEGLFLVDYDGDGNMPYILKRDSLIVYYDHGVERGIIKKLTDDSLILGMDGYEVAYVRWKK